MFCPAQLQWVSLSAPQCQMAAYDSARDRVVGYAGSTMWEFDGLAWQVVPSNMPPLVAWGYVFDEQRRVTVAISSFVQAVWEWDGTSWTNPGTVPFFVWNYPTYFGYHLVYHPRRKRVLIFVAGAFGSELHEWDGVAWTLVPTTNAPLVRISPFTQFSYHALVYDRATDKLVLFGRAEVQNTGGVIADESRTWEWDETTGWLEFPPSGTLRSTFMWFDAHRGKMVRYDEGLNPPTVHIRDDDAIWRPIAYSLNGLSPTVFAGCHDPLRNRFYSYQNATNDVAYLTDLYPAEYSPHGAGCVAPAPPELRLTAPWTRAWLGGALGTTVVLAPQSVAVLCTGLSDTLFGTTPLPFDLSALGMPSCSLRVAPELIQLGLGSHGRVTFALPIPADPILVGTVFYQQALVPAPGANPAGLRVSNSTRGRIGRSH